MLIRCSPCTFQSLMQPKPMSHALRARPHIVVEEPLPARFDTRPRFAAPGLPKSGAQSGPPARPTHPALTFRERTNAFDVPIPFRVKTSARAECARPELHPNTCDFPRARSKTLMSARWWRSRPDRQPPDGHLNAALRQQCGAGIRASPNSSTSSGRSRG